jgi:hypothetical protein
MFNWINLSCIVGLSFFEISNYLTSYYSQKVLSSNSALKIMGDLAHFMQGNCYDNKVQGVSMS